MDEGRKEGRKGELNSGEGEEVVKRGGRMKKREKSFLWYGQTSWQFWLLQAARYYDRAIAFYGNDRVGTVCVYVFICRYIHIHVCDTHTHTHTFETLR